MLGVDYECASRKHMRLDTVRWDNAMRRLKRIGMVASHDLGVRVRFIVLLVLSMFTWRSAWQDIPSKKMRALANAIEAAAVGHARGGRSRLIRLDALPANINPWVATGLEAASVVKWKATRRLNARRVGQTSERDPAIKVLKTFSWAWNGGATFVTRDGTIDLTKTGEATTKQIMRRLERQNVGYRAES